MTISDKRYQVFISSTYTDLKEERAKVTEAVLELGHMPNGMEIFPAANESQWECITREIDKSDYYIVIVGGRYGSIKPDTGLSYTEEEYRYATEKGIPSIAFIVDDSVDLKTSKAEPDPDKKQKLDAFKRYISGSRLWKSYTSPDNLKAQVAISLSILIKKHPREGWIRANSIIATSNLGTDKNSSKSFSHNNHDQQEEKYTIATSNLGTDKNSSKSFSHNNHDQQEEKYTIFYSLVSKSTHKTIYNGIFKIGWEELFYCIAKSLNKYPKNSYDFSDHDKFPDFGILNMIITSEQNLYKEFGIKKNDIYIWVDEDYLKTIYKHFENLYLMSSIYSSCSFNFRLTDLGYNKFLDLKIKYHD